ncbi:MAG: lysophospholipid acyltransferase family protein [Planctomycetota bacterium]
MNNAFESRSPFRLIQSDRRRPILRPLATVAEVTLGLRRLESLHSSVKDSLGASPSAEQFIETALDALKVETDTPEDDIAEIPTEGPVVVVANHPFGAIEGLVMLQVMLAKRKDVRVLANHILSRFDALSEHLIAVNPFGGKDATRNNARPLKEALRFLEGGGMLIVFPAGEVAHRRWGRRGIVDPEWNPTVARLLRRTGAGCLPVYFGGHNGELFQLAGLAHPVLRTLLLPRALLRSRGRTIRVRIGRLVDNKGFDRFADERELVDYLRLRTLILGRRLASELGPRGPKRLVQKFKPKSVLAPIVEPVDPNLLQRDIDQLPEDALMDSASGLQVFLAGASRLPNVLHEIGRLREVTFRDVGEGTGRPIDLDRHDQDYEHLFVWDPKTREIVGAYRVGKTDRLLSKGGLSAVYSSSLFELDPAFVNHVTPGLELGRSWVRSDRQRAYLPLMLLWRGIGSIAVREPRYCKVFGPVSISAAYEKASRELLVDHLREHENLPEFAEYVKPRHPVKGGVVKRFGFELTPSMVADLADVSQMVAEIERDEKGVPVLVREYLKMGGKILGFNVDPEFRNVVDGLVFVDMRETHPRLLTRYLGKDGIGGFYEYHGIDPEKLPARKG